VAEHFCLLHAVHGGRAVLPQAAARRPSSFTCRTAAEQVDGDFFQHSTFSDFSLKPKP
jgi:hypothetical protein